MMAESYPPAPRLRRVVARVLDAAIVLPVGYLLVRMAEATEGQPISPETETMPVALAALYEAVAGGLLVWFVYEVVAVARWGRTVGKAAAGIRVIPAEPAFVPSWGRRVRRYHLLEEQRLQGCIEQMSGETSPRGAFGGLIAGLRIGRLAPALGRRAAGRDPHRLAAAHMDHLQRRQTVRPGRAAGFDADRCAGGVPLGAGHRRGSRRRGTARSLDHLDRSASRSGVGLDRLSRSSEPWSGCSRHDRPDRGRTSLSRPAGLVERVWAADLGATHPLNDPCRRARRPAEVPCARLVPPWPPRLSPPRQQLVLAAPLRRSSAAGEARVSRTGSARARAVRKANGRSGVLSGTGMARRVGIV